MRPSSAWVWMRTASTSLRPPTPMLWACASGSITWTPRSVVPGRHVLYVWFDALTNYLTAAGFPDDPGRVEHWWPADTHVIGKDITRFHCVYWPAMLMAAGVPVPRQVAVHGFMTLEGQRISKTTGNTIDPVELVEEWGADAIRYYVLRDVSFDRDGDFNRANLRTRYTSDLANDTERLRPCATCQSG
ncbi:MAG: hypothetical protein EBT47_02965 [Chloroflexi bacterium]|nr:hypothetical protein [Chloroflexota bacterium]